MAVELRTVSVNGIRMRIAEQGEGHAPGRRRGRANRGPRRGERHRRRSRLGRAGRLGERRAAPRNIDRNWELLAPWYGVRITPPALYLVGDRDTVLGFLPVPDSLGALREFAPQARDLIRVRDCGHWTQQEQPSVVSDALVDFAKSLG